MKRINLRPQIKAAGERVLRGAKSVGRCCYCNYVRAVEWMFYSIRPCSEKFYKEMHAKSDAELREEILARGLDGCSTRRYNALVNIAAMRFMAQGKPNDDNRN